MYYILYCTFYSIRYLHCTLYFTVNCTIYFIVYCTVHCPIHCTVNISVQGLLILEKLPSLPPAYYLVHYCQTRYCTMYCILYCRLFCPIFFALYCKLYYILYTKSDCTKASKKLANSLRKTTF